MAELFVEKMGMILSVHHHPWLPGRSCPLADLSRERFYCNNANSDAGADLCVPRVAVASSPTSTFRV